MRILVTRLKFLGDIVLTTPMLDVLRERHPDASIEYLGLEPHVSVLEDHPCIDVLHRLPAQPSFFDTVRCIRTLRSGPRIDWAFDLFSNPRSALLVAASGARKSVGSDRGLRSRLYRYRRSRPEGDRSAIRHHLDKLVPMLGEEVPPRPTRLAVSASRRSALEGSLGLREGQRLVVVHPGSTWPDKAWPEERWPGLVSWLIEQYGGDVVVVCPPGDEATARTIAAASGARLLPPLRIPELVALLEHARLYVGNDGGILHMAVAQRVPTVGLFGPTEPDIWFPYTQWGPFEVLHDCGPEAMEPGGRPASRLTAITEDAVREAVRRVVSQGAST